MVNDFNDFTALLTLVLIDRHDLSASCGIRFLKRLEPYLFFVFFIVVE